MAFKKLIGNELIQMIGIQPNGLPSGNSFLGRSADIAELANANVNPASGIVGQRCGNNAEFGELSSTGNYMTFHQRVLFPQGADLIRLIYPNFYISTSDAGEQPMNPSMFQAVSVAYSGGSNYAVGYVDTFSCTSSQGIAPVKVMITAVSGGAPTQAQIIDGGLYQAPLGSSQSPASSYGSATGATATFTWGAVCMGVHIGIEPVWNSLIAPSTQSGSVEIATKGYIATATYDSTLSVPLNDFLITDPIPVDIAPGQAVGIRLSCGYGTPQIGRMPINSTYVPNAPAANNEASFGAATFTDYSASGTIGATVNNGILQPLAIIGIPKKITPTIIAIGDSRLYGNSSGTNSISAAGQHFDSGDTDGNIGWFEKALSATIGLCNWPWINLGTQGDSLGAAFTTGGRAGRLKTVAMCRPLAVYLGLNVNDFAAGTPLATVKNLESLFINELRGLGVKYIFTDTTDPYTTSSDSWATVANQTLSAYSGVMVQRNEALAAGAWANYDFFIDQRPNVESSINSGKWAANGSANYYTGDGIHGSPQIITLKANTAASVISQYVQL